MDLSVKPISYVHVHMCKGKKYNQWLEKIHFAIHSHCFNWKYTEKAPVCHCCYKKKKKINPSKNEIIILKTKSEAGR